MSKTTSSNYTSPNAATYHSADSDVYSRLDSYTGFLQDLDVHDHRTGKGLGAGRITSTAIAATANTGECAVITGGIKVTDGTTQQQLLDVTQNGVTAYKAIGLTGATAASRYAGATTSGAPGSGTFAVGDYIVDQTGVFWICTTAGSPGTWTKAGTPPTGIITAYGAGTTDPTGGFLCDGRAVSRTTYAALYAVIGTDYGTGDGSTTFNLPDFRSRVLMGADDMGTSAGAASRTSSNNALGNTSGADTSTAILAHTHSHSHTVTDTHQHNTYYKDTVSVSSGGTQIRQIEDSANATANLLGTLVAGTGSISLATDATSGGSGTSFSLRNLNQIANLVIWQ